MEMDVIISMFIDTHCHVTKEDTSDINLYLQKSRENGVSPIIVSACDLSSIKEDILLAEKEADVFLTIGFHPEVVDQIKEDDFVYLESLLLHPKVVGIGEIGLDYHYTKENKDAQKKLFMRQMKLAKKYHLPVVIHSRDAIQDTYDIICEFPTVIGDLHCYSGSVEMAQRFIERGYRLGIGGVVTFKNSKLYQVIEAFPLDSFLLETDSPYLSPEPFRGMENGSYRIPVIAKRIADIKGISLQEVERIIYENTCLLFDFKKGL